MQGAYIDKVVFAVAVFLFNCNFLSIIQHFVSLVSTIIYHIYLSRVYIIMLYNILFRKLRNGKYLARLSHKLREVVFIIPGSHLWQIFRIVFVVYIVHYRNRGSIGTQAQKAIG